MNNQNWTYTIKGKDILMILTSSNLKNALSILSMAKIKYPDTKLTAQRG